MSFRISRRRLAVIAALIAGAVALVAYSGIAQGSGSRAHGGHGPQRFTVGLFGDMPYNALGRAEYPNLLADVNDHKVAFSVFDGDLKAGGDGPCSDSLYTTAIANFDTLDRPLIWVPGDNDWTDCWGRYGPGTQPYSDPEERLDHERQLFDSTNQSLGRRTLTLARESYEGGQWAQYSENVRWVYGPVVFVGLNVQGSNDNYPHAGVDGETRGPAEIARQRAEHGAREAANIHWLDESFAYAKRNRARGVMIVWQADPDFNNEYKLPSPDFYDGFDQIVPALRDDVLAFPGQVALVHGDSHYFKLDKPLNSPSGKVLANFTRVETFGATNTHWVSASIDPRDPNLFEFQPRMVAANIG
jgi:hypothetical protein